MEATFLDANLGSCLIVDVFKSFLWIDRYDEFGEFEITALPTSELLLSLLEAKFVIIEDSDHIMVIEDVNINTDTEEGHVLIIKGRSIETILERRVVWDPTTLEGDFQDAISMLLTANAINPTEPARQLTKLEFLASEDPIITALEVDTQAYGETLYDVVSILCGSKNIGFKIILTPSNKFQFQLYCGVDRSYNQSTNSYVVFSPSFDNLLNSAYGMSERYSKTVARVAGEAGIGNERTHATAESPTGTTDMDRKEMFVDAGSITRNVSGEEPLGEEEYIAKLVERGQTALSENSPLEVFDGKVEFNGMFQYGRDFLIGDIIQIANEYGHEGESRITELTFYQDLEGFKMVPTLEAIT